MHLSCTNPTQVQPGNRATCESLPSQLANFTQQFFGPIVKTDSGDTVNWMLPCGLDVGLPSNPRGFNEGLSCYFLRLFNTEISGLEGRKGDTGQAGCDGVNNFAVTLLPFVTPAVGGSVSVPVNNPVVFLTDEHVAIEHSGQYIVKGVVGNVVTFQLESPLSVTLPVVPIGSIVVPTGLRGASILGDIGHRGNKGPQGIQGIQGNVGPAGPDGLTSLQYYTGAGGTDFAGAGHVDFGTSAPRMLLAAPGTYMVYVTAGVSSPLLTRILQTVQFSMVNFATSATIPTAFFERFGWPQVNPVRFSLSLAFLMTTTQPNQTIGLNVQTGATGTIKVVASETSITAIQLI